jgi:hypothetical protein
MSLYQRAVCVPSSCGPVDVESMLNHTLARVGNFLGVSVYAEVFEENCYTTIDKPWSIAELVFV